MPTDDELQKAFCLISFLHPDRAVALCVLQDACDRISVIRRVQQRRPDSSRPFKLKIPEESLIQLSAYGASEVWEKDQESEHPRKEPRYKPSADDLLARYVKTIIWKAMDRPSRYAAVGLGCLLYTYQPHEVSGLAEEFFDSDNIRRDKSWMFDQIKLRFGGARGLTNGHEYVALERPSRRQRELIQKSLSAFAPWSSCPASNGRAPGASLLETYFDRKSELTELERVHVLCDPTCGGLPRLIHEYNSTYRRGNEMRLDDPEEKLGSPKFGGGPHEPEVDGGNDGPPDLDERFNPLPLTRHELSSIKHSVERNQQRRKNYSSGRLRVCIDGEEVAAIADDNSAEPFVVPDTASCIEVLGEDDQGELLLAVFPLNCMEPDELPGVATRQLSVTHDGGQTIELTLSPALPQSQESRETVARLSYVKPPCEVMTGSADLYVLIAGNLSGGIFEAGVSDDMVTAVLPRRYGVPSVNLELFDVDDSVIRLIPREVAEKYSVLPLSRVGATLTLAMVDPTNVFAMDDIKFITGLNIEPVVVSEASVQEAISRYYSTSRENMTKLGFEPEALVKFQRNIVDSPADNVQTGDVVPDASVTPATVRPAHAPCDWAGGFGLTSGYVVGSRYRILEAVGCGELGPVYLAQDKEWRENVTIKVIEPPDDALYIKEELERTLRESYEALARVYHSGVERPLDFGELHDGRPYVVTEWVSGVSLRGALGRQAMEPSRIADVSLQIVAALGAVHDLGILHCDLKPENIMLHQVDGQERVKLIDFGVSRVVNVSGLSSATKTDHDADICFVNSPLYTAPEQLRGEPASAASDIWSLGCVLYEMLTGRRPFNPNSPSHLLELQRAGADLDAVEMRSASMQRARDVLAKALAFEPRRRYRSAEEFGTEIEGALAGQWWKTAAGAPTRIHILFLDAVSYSQLTAVEQYRWVKELMHIVRGTRQVQEALVRDQLLSLPTGDGLALVFTGADPSAVVQCAVEIALALKSRPEFKLRMGVHTHPSWVGSIGGRGVLCDAVHVARQVTDCGNAGGISLSKAVADELNRCGGWSGHLQDRGERLGKHGHRVCVFNLYTGEVGEPY